MYETDPSNQIARKKVINADLWKSTGQILLTDTIKKREWQWIGHTLRHSHNNITKQSLEWNLKSRPTTTWRRITATELLSCNLSLGEANISDRNRWKTVVDAL